MSIRQFYYTWISPQRWLERIGVRAPMQIVIGLVLLTSCVLTFAKPLQLAPNEDDLTLRLRAQLAELAASRVGSEIAAGNDAAASNFLDELVKRQNDVLSAGLRALDGKIILETTDHEKYWKGSGANANSPTHIPVMLYNGPYPWGEFEIAFKPLQSPSIWSAPLSNQNVRLAIFILGSCFLFFWLFLSRMLRMLDPSSAVPERMQLMMDTLVEGIVILDDDDRIVMVNQSFARTAFAAVDRLIGQSLSSLPWLAHDGAQTLAVYPWQTVRESKLPERGVSVRLQIGTRHTRCLNVNASPILDPGGTRRGVLVTFNDQTVVESDNVELTRLLGKFGEASEGIHRFREQLKLLGDHGNLAKLEELAAAAREVVSATRTDVESASPNRNDGNGALEKGGEFRAAVVGNETTVNATFALNPGYKASDDN